MNLFVTGLFVFGLLTCALTTTTASFRPNSARHNPPLSTLPVVFSHEFGARIRQPDMFVASASNTFGTKTSKTLPIPASSTEAPEAISELTKSDDGNNDNLSFSREAGDDESAFSENVLGDFSRHDSTSAAQNTMDDMVERMKMATLRRAMQSIKKQEEDAEQHEQHEQEHETDNDQQFLEQESFDDRRRGRKNNIIGGQGDIQIAVKSRRKYEMAPVHFDRQNGQTPRMIEIVSDTMPLRLHFRSKSSAIVVSQSHDPTPMKAIEEKVTMDEPYRLAHEVHKPIIQEVREFIQPYRTVIQTLRPVIEDIRTVVPKDSDVAHQHRYRPGKTNNANDSTKRLHGPATKSIKNGREEQMTIPTMNYASWSHQKPILRPPPPRNMVRQQQRQHPAGFLRSPANQISVQRPPKINGNLNLEASEPKFVYAVLTNGTENDLNSGQEYVNVETYPGESEKVSESREIEQVTESSPTLPQLKIEAGREERFVGIDSVSNRRNDKHAEDGAARQRASTLTINGRHDQAQTNRFPPIDSADTPSLTPLTPPTTTTDNHSLNQHSSSDINKQLQFQLEQLHNNQLRQHQRQHKEMLKRHPYAFPYTSHDADGEPFILNDINFGRAYGQHHHVHHQHHHHLHHRIHHRLPFGI